VVNVGVTYNLLRFFYFSILFLKTAVLPKDLVRILRIYTDTSTVIITISKIVFVLIVKTVNSWLFFDIEVHEWVVMFDCKMIAGVVIVLKEKQIHYFAEF